MAMKKHLEGTLREFQLDKPEAKWEELLEHYLDSAVQIVATEVRPEEVEGLSLVYANKLSDLGEIAATAALTVPQLKATILGARVMQAVEKRFRKDPQALVDIIEEMEKELQEAKQAKVPKAPEAPLGPVVIPEAPPVTFSQLGRLYVAEHKSNVKPTTLDDIQYVVKVVSEALTDPEGNELDLRKHTREDMIKLKEALLSTRRASTVNKVLARFSSILNWAVNNDYLTKTLDKGLKIAKGADSTRKPYSQDQVKAIMAHANGLPADSWQRWAISLGVLTGARIREIRLLRKEDIKNLGGYTVIDINEDAPGKTIKNKHSKRVVPLVDGAYGFDLRAFLAFVEGTRKEHIFIASQHFNTALNNILREVVGTEAGGDWSFHSLRHTMASLLKSKGAQVEIAQAILGHSSGTITFDHYGATERIALERMVTTLKDAFGLSG